MLYHPASLMPVCVRCDVAYLPGEHHACVVKPTGRTSFAVLAAVVLIVGLILMLWSYAVQASPDGRVWFPFLTAVFVMPLGVVLMSVGLIALLMYRATRVRDRLS
jgi:hypothetical protein